MIDGHIFVFVYGTLRKQERNHYVLEDAECIAEQAWTHGQMFETVRDYPVVGSAIEDFVYGELFRVSAEVLRQLDDLEGYTPGAENNLYDRLEQTVFTDTGMFTAYVYVLASGTFQIKQGLMSHGDWKVARLTQQPSFFYFAYGSCMDDNRFKLQQADHHFTNVAGRGVLPGYTLRYTRQENDGGRADIVEEGGIIEGKVYEITPEVLPYLYRREGVAMGDYRPAVVTVTLNEVKRSALTFIVRNKNMETAPPWHYMEEILRGGRAWCSDAYFKKLKLKYDQLRENSSETES